jgi:hypothetical protein
VSSLWTRSSLASRAKIRLHASGSKLKRKRRLQLWSLNSTRWPGCSTYVVQIFHLTLASHAMCYILSRAHQTTVFFAYACVTPTKVTLFTRKERLDPETIQVLEADQVAIEPYDSIVQYLETNPLCSTSEVRLECSSVLRLSSPDVVEGSRWKEDECGPRECYWKGNSPASWADLCSPRLLGQGSRWQSSGGRFKIHKN